MTPAQRNTPASLLCLCAHAVWLLHCPFRGFTTCAKWSFSVGRRMRLGLLSLWLPFLFPSAVRSLRVIKKEASHQREWMCGLPIRRLSSRRDKFHVSPFLDTAAKIILWNSIRNRGFQSVKITKVDKSCGRI